MEIYMKYRELGKTGKQVSIGNGHEGNPNRPAGNDDV